MRNPPKEVPRSQDSPAQGGSRGEPFLPTPEKAEPSYFTDDALRDLTRKLKETASSKYTESTQGSSKYTDLRYTKFNIGGIPGDKHAVFIPDNLKLSVPVLQEVCAALDKDMPSMLLSGVSTLCHPAKLSSPQLRKCCDFRPLMNDAKSSLGLQGVPLNDDGLCCCKPRNDVTTELQQNDPEVTNKQLIDVANRVFEKKMSSTLMSVAKGAYRANVWTFTGPKLSNFEVFLQQTMGHGEAEVFRMAAAHMQDKAWMEADSSRNLMRYMFNCSQAMSPETVNRSTAITVQGDFWNPSKNPSHCEFKEHGFEYWSFESYDDEMSRGHPITQFPWPHADLLFLFYREESCASRSQTAEADWDFMTKKRFDLDALPFSPEMLAPVSYIFIGGNEAKMKKKLMHAIRQSSPIIILDNTPNVPKQISLLVNIVQKVFGRTPLASCRPFMADDVRLGPNPSVSEMLEAMMPSAIMKHVENEFDSSGMEESEKITLSDIVGLLDFVKRRPQSFKDAVCVVDPLHSSPERIISQAAHVLSRNPFLSREANTTVVFRSLVMKAWRLHRKLVRKAQDLRTLATVLTVSIAVVMLLCTALATCAAIIRLERGDPASEDLLYNVTAPVKNQMIVVSFNLSDELGLIKLALLALPMIAGLLIALQGHFQVAQKWAIVHMAASETVSEIYWFLGSVGPYAGSSSMAQRRFVSRLQDTVKNLSQAGYDDDMVGDDSAEDGFPQDSDELEQHVGQSLYGIQPMNCARRRLQECAATMVQCSPCCGWTSLLMDAQESKDMAAPVSAESYMEVRVQPLRKYYSAMHQRLMSVRNVLHFLLVLTLAVGSALGASGLSMWIPTALAIATFFNTLINWLAPSEMLAAVNQASTTLKDLDLRWKGTDIMENQREGTKTGLIQLTEKIAWAVASTYSGASMALGDLEDMDDDHMQSHTSRGSREVALSISRSNSRANSGYCTPYSRTGSMTPFTY